MDTTAVAPMLARGSDEAFAGQIGREYQTLKLICPAAADMSRQVGDFVAAWVPPRGSSTPLQLIEIGVGTGITTAALLQARSDTEITAVDIASTMIEQAAVNLASWCVQGRVRFVESDALSFLRTLPEGQFDLVASGYALHNFQQDYREAAVHEIFRVLRPGGVLVNGDRYALDDHGEQLKVVQDELRQYFRVLTAMERLDLLEHWVVHLFSDESPQHLMPLTPALNLYRSVGFDPVQVHDRYQNNALVSAVKPET